MKNKKLIPYIIEEAYRLFASYSITPPLTVCDCGNCINEKEQKLLITTPLRETSRELIETYISAMFDNEDKAIVELRYFLPRMLELLSVGETLYIDEGFSLSRCHFERTHIWKEGEIAFMERFAKAFFEEVLEGECPHPYSTAEDWLVCFGLSGLSITPLLDSWLKQADKVKALYDFQELFTYSFSPIGIVFKHSYFKDKRPELNEQITTWLMLPHTQQTFLQATENLLLSDIELEEEVLLSLENLYNQLRLNEK